MYRIAIFDNIGTRPAAMMIQSPIVKGWKKKLNAPGSMVFSLPMGDTRATTANLQPYRWVQLLREKRDGTDEYEVVWGGYIEASKENGSVTDVLCQGFLNFFKKRLTAKDQTFSGGASSDAFGLLTTTNAADGGNANTGITTGTGGIVTTNSTKAQGLYDILRAWEMIAQANGGEYEITDSGVFNFVPLLGTDKSSGDGRIIMRYRRDGTPGSNCVVAGLGSDGGNMINRCIGATSTGPLTSTKNNTTNQFPNGLDYPILIEQKQFNEAQSQDALDAMTQRYVDQRANPITDYSIQPLSVEQVFDIVTGGKKLRGIDYGDVGVGDLILANIVTENQDIQEAKRIAEITVQVDGQGNEQIFYTLSEAGIYVTAAMLDSDQVSELKRRIKEIEAVL